MLVGRHCETLSPTALRLIMEGAEIIHEGETSRDPDGTHYYGSVMLSCDLEILGAHTDRPLDEAQMKRICEHLRGHPYFRVHLMRLARREVHRRLGSLPLVPLRAQMKLRLEGTRMFADMDVEVHDVLDRRLAQDA